MGSKNTTTVQKADPWAPVQSYLKDMLPLSQNLFNQGGFGPESFTSATGQSTVAPQSAATQDALARISAMASGSSPLLAGGANTVNAGMNASSLGGGVGNAFTSGMNASSLGGGVGGVLSNFMDPAASAANLDAVKANALGSAIPAATSMFSGSGMANSSAAMDTVGRAATDAIAPYQYGANENALARAMQAAGLMQGAQAGDNAQRLQAAGLMQGAQAGDTAQRLQAASMAPSMYQAGYMPAQMQGQVGSSQDAYAQALRDAQVGAYTQDANAPMTNIMNYAGLLQGQSGLGGTQSSTAPGQSFAQRAGGSLLGGLGMYGALAGASIPAPFAAGGGILAGLMGLL
jgi:hypothetical protein